MTRRLAETRGENKRVVRAGIRGAGIDVRITCATLRLPRPRHFPMGFLVRIMALLVGSTAIACATPPTALASALEYLRDQKTYSWEIINGDPGPVAQQFETRRGTVTTVQQNTLPNLKGQIDRAG